MELCRSPQTRLTRALWTLEETGIPYDRELVDI